MKAAKKVLVIDSHKGNFSQAIGNLHWKNARAIADELGGDLIWSYPGVNDEVVSGYEKIVFVHASAYSYTDYKWLEASPDAKLFYVTNEYNLGEPRTLWMAAKNGRKYTVIANHPQAASKVVDKYVDGWEVVNLNALCYKRRRGVDFGMFGPMGCIYYGSFRKDRSRYFAAYFSSGKVTISTHEKNIPKFLKAGAVGPFIPRLDIDAGDLALFSSSLYIEDETTHVHYNFLANRFYECLSYDIPLVFDSSCYGTVEKSGYQGASIINDPSELESATIAEGWHEQAGRERLQVLMDIHRLVLEQ